MRFGFDYAQLIANIAKYAKTGMNPTGRACSRAGPLPIHLNPQGRDPTMSATTKEVLEARADIFKALGHPTRLAIVDMLAGGERCVCEINEIIDADMSTVSRHLSVLRNVGILASDKRGNQVFYRLECPCITSFYGCIESVISGGGGAVRLEASR
jgi:DNA-binding transcriptional ArsR family regulator